MLKLMICGIALLSTSLCNASAMHIQDRIYIDSEDFDSNAIDNEFHIHIGDNIWITTNIIHRDASGMYAYESNIIRSDKCEYQKQWKCPYCHKYWPIGKMCGNPDCPSKYKE